MDLKGVVDLLGVVTNARNSKQLIAAQRAVLDAQARELALNEEIRKLKAAVAERDEKINQKDAADAELAQYEQCEINGTWVMIKAGQPKGPFYCSGCYDSGRKKILAPMSSTFHVIGTHRCPSCDTAYTLL